MDWVRKHLGDLARICKNKSADGALNEEQRNAFADAHAKACEASVLPAGGGPASVRNVLATTCLSCRNSLRITCTGRSDWDERCEFVNSSVCFDSPSTLRAPKALNCP